MTCSKCHRHLPDDSEFCQYCGERLTMPQPAVIPQTTTQLVRDYSPQPAAYQAIPQPVPPVVKPPKPKKSPRFCKYCGGLVDPHTNQCTKCGKQFFRLTRKAVLPLVLAAVLLVSGVCNIYQQVKVNSLQEDIDILEERINGKQYVTSSASGKSAFMDRYIVLVPNNGSHTYHKYGCEDLELSSFWAFNQSKAEEEGYVPCRKCC